jgi:hypothetical protein
LEALGDDGRVEPQSRSRPFAEPDRAELVGVGIDPAAGDVERHGDL